MRVSKRMQHLSSKLRGIKMGVAAFCVVALPNALAAQTTYHDPKGRFDLQVPAGWQVSGLPQGWQKATGPISFSLTAQNNNGNLHLERKLTISFILLDRKYYTAFRNYFQQIKVADDQQFILDAPVAKAAN